MRGQSIPARWSLFLTAVVLCGLLVTAAPAIAAPEATTGGASEVTQTGARVHGEVADSAAPGESVQYFFEYGTTTSYGSQTSTETSSGEVSRLLSGLSPGTLYHYRLVAMKGGATARGEDRTFTTASPPDADGDGYPDNGDACPNQPGGAQGPYNGPGCPPPPDSDGDGYVDPQDPCPGARGPAQGPYNAQGCPPPPDTDGDGYVDPQDPCPGARGGPEGPYNPPGCPPPPDSDGDGYVDPADPCSRTPGPAASQFNNNQNGCPDADSDGDGIPNQRDQCPDERPGGPAVATVQPDARGCRPFIVTFSLKKLVPPSPKELVKKGYAGNVYVEFGGGPFVPNEPLVKLKATLLLDAATTRKLKLRSSAIDTTTDESARAATEPEHEGRYAFWSFKVPRALRKRLGRLKRFTVTIKWELTSMSGQKYSYTGTAGIGSKVKPKDPVPG